MVQLYFKSPVDSKTSTDELSDELKFRKYNGKKFVKKKFWANFGHIPLSERVFLDWKGAKNTLIFGACGGLFV